MRDPLARVLADKGGVIYSVTPYTAVVDAVHTMNRHGIGAVLVMDEEDLVGIFTERDVLCRVVTPGLQPASTQVGQVMTRDVVFVSPNTTVEEAMAIVTEKRCRHLPVLDQRRVVGLISIGDLTRWVTRGQVFELQQLINYVTDRYPA